MLKLDAGGVVIMDTTTSQQKCNKKCGLVSQIVELVLQYSKQGVIRLKDLSRDKNHLAIMLSCL